jgi:hypothetical protein
MAGRMQKLATPLSEQLTEEKQRDHGCGVAGAEGDQPGGAAQDELGKRESTLSSTRSLPELSAARAAPNAARTAVAASN